MIGHSPDLRGEAGHAAGSRHDEPFRGSGSDGYDEDGGAIVGIGIGALSGFLVGLIISGQFTTMVLTVLIGGCSAAAGWWTRGVVR